MRAFAVLRHPLFVGAALLYGSYQLARHWLRWPLPPWLTSYLGDVLFLPLLLSVALMLHRVWLRNDGATLPVAWVLAAYVGVAVWFEGVLPLYSARATADPLDVLAYGVGAWVFLRWLNRPG